jgi:2-dehydro-3-deoxyphosphogluconate aldolase / (4S)-4-hydroxy-2-oxoglutarate aldolase
MTNILEILQRERVVVVIRGAEAATLGQELRALYEGGLRIFEVTVEAPGAINALTSVREQLPQDALLGAGTVLDAGTASLVVAAGAQFVVSPIILKEVCQVTRAHGVPCILGGSTPTEIHAAYRCGSEVVKVFPASTVGPGFLRELKGPLGFIPLYPTGGITLENARTFLDAGAVALGVGSALVKKEWVERGDWNALRREASAWAAFRQAG